MKIKTKLFILLLMAFSIGINAQVPYGLNSNPSAAPTAFLDFDGAVVDDPYWRPFSGDSIIYCEAATLTRAQMIKIFNHIAEDFSPFNINITTDSSVYFAAPITKRTRVIFTPTSSWYGSSGGVAYIESFRWGLNTPCFVFSSLLGNNDKRVAEAASHEIGHTLGLYHQSQYANIGTDSCRFVTEYFAGRGSSDIGWSPIMGNSYSRNLTTWHIGISSIGCTFPQNDFAVITNPINGITYRADDHGNTINTATNVNIIDGIFSTAGIINDSNDLDHFKFQLNVPGRFIVNIKPYNTGKEIIAVSPLLNISNYNANTDLEVTLFRNNIQIAKYNPINLLSVSIDTLLDAGNYTIRVNNIANTNIFKGLLLGTYTLAGSFGGGVVVPIRNININGEMGKSGHRIGWQIDTDEEVEKVWIEVSPNNYEFRKLKYVNELNGVFEYIPNDKDAYYRIGAKTLSGATNYSYTVYIKPIINSNYKIISNTIYNNQLIVNTKKIYEWRLIDMSGKKVSSGRFINGQNVIEMPNNSGIYLIQIIGDVTPHLEKIIKL